MRFIDYLGIWQATPAEQRAASSADHIAAIKDIAALYPIPMHMAQGPGPDGRVTQEMLAARAAQEMALSAPLLALYHPPSHGKAFALQLLKKRGPNA